MRLHSWIFPLGFLPLALSFPTPQGQSLVASTNNRELSTGQGHTPSELYYDDRKPALYTQDYGSCMNNPPIRLDHYHAAFYKDNMSLTFSFGGQTRLQNDESLVLMLSVYAYGQRRVSLRFNACQANIHSLCPPSPNKPISTFGVIPVSAENIAFVPPVAFNIPDFEGKTVVQIFSTNTRSQVACLTAGVTNGSSMSQPNVVNLIVVVFVFFAVVLSAYPLMGEPCNNGTNRIRYVNSVSVFLACAIVHYVFFSSAISVEWPRILISFWSNFSWLSGMMYNSKMQRALSRITPNNGRTLQKLIRGSQPTSPSGAFSLSEAIDRKSPTVSVGKRDASEAYVPGGNFMNTQFALPGTYNGLSGMLSELKIPISNAMLTGFIMFLLFITGVAIMLCILKFFSDMLTRYSTEHRPGVKRFQHRWASIAVFTLGRIFVAFFFMLSFLAIFQFALRVGTGPISVGIVLFLIIVIGTTSVVSAIVLNHLRNTGRRGRLPPYENSISGLMKKAKEVFWEETPSSANSALNPHLSDDNSDSDYVLPTLPVYRPHIGKSTFLGIRFRQSRWWLFIPWLVYDFMRACFLAGAVECPIAQIAGSLALEVMMILVIYITEPFSDKSVPSPVPRRTNVNTVLVYLLSASKISTTALSIAFLPKLRVSRITATVIGVIIILIQAVLVIVLFAAIAMNAIWGYFILRSSEKHDKLVESPFSRAVDMSSLSATPSIHHHHHHYHHHHHHQQQEEQQQQTLPPLESDPAVREPQSVLRDLPEDSVQLTQSQAQYLDQTICADHPYASLSEWHWVTPLRHSYSRSRDGNEDGEEGR